MSEYSQQDREDYITFLETIQKDMMVLVDSAKRTVQFAPADRKQVMEETAKFLSIYAHTVVGTEIMTMKLKMGLHIVKG